MAQITDNGDIFHLFEAFIDKLVLDSLARLKRRAGVKDTFEEEVLTKTQAARYLKVSSRKLDRLVAEGEIKKIKSGRSVRFRKQDLEKYLKNALE